MTAGPDSIELVTQDFSPFSCYNNRLDTWAVEAVVWTTFVLQRVQISTTYIHAIHVSDLFCFYRPPYGNKSASAPGTLESKGLPVSTVMVEVRH